MRISGGKSVPTIRFNQHGTQCKNAAKMEDLTAAAAEAPLYARPRLK
jgi:hypothetical protein